MSAFTRLVGALLVVSATSSALADPPVEPPDAVVCRGTSGEGFSYAWGGECWCTSGCSPDLGSCAPGDCTPNPGSTGCPDCTHSGTYGADCSGFVTKAWQVPDPVALDACGVFRYVAADFHVDGPYWDPVPMTGLRPADAVASDSHVILVIGFEDAYGEHEVVEAQGCNYGIVRHSRTFSTSFTGARRVNLTECVCAAGDRETQACGDCGSQERTCSDSCTWTAWSPCDGPDPTGDVGCTVAGGVGACAAGRSLCVAGWLTCEPEAAATELCDGIDNDCDGVTDNGTPASLGEGYPCPGDCGAGVSRCIDGAVRCVTEPGACDGGGDDYGGGDGGGNDAGDGGRRDGGVAVEDEGSGCSCGVASGGGPFSLLSLLVVAGLIARRRR
jgi:MYXO-CTERM domain-containing protein